MNTRSRCSLLCAGLLALGLGIGTAIAWGQLPIEPAESSVLFKLQGNRYERRVFDSDGELEGRQVFDFELLRYRDEECLLPVALEVYEAPDFAEVEEEFEVTVRVDCAEPHLIASVFAFGSGRRAGHFEIAVVGEGQIYPRELEIDRSLPDLRFILTVKEGLLSLLGSRCEMRVTRRRIVEAAGGLDQFRSDDLVEILGRLEVDYYLLGLRWKGDEYTTRQLLSRQHGLVKEMLEHTEGVRV